MVEGGGQQGSAVAGEKEMHGMVYVNGLHVCLCSDSLYFWFVNCCSRSSSKKQLWRNTAVIHQITKRRMLTLGLSMLD